MKKKQSLTNKSVLISKMQSLLNTVLHPRLSTLRRTIFNKEHVFPFMVLLISPLLAISFNSAHSKSSSNSMGSVKENTDTPIYVMVHAKDNTTFSSENTATITSLPLKEGDSFQAGNTLIQFDCRLPQAELKKALARLAFTDSSYTSAKKLESYGSISQFELIKAQSEAEMATADVDKLYAIIDKCTIKAPYNGSISAVMVNIGETVKPSDPLLKIINAEALELQMQIPSIWLKWLKVETPFNVNITEINKTLPAKVTKINPEINPVSQTVKIIGTLTAFEPILLPGMSGQAIFKE